MYAGAGYHPGAAPAVVEANVLLAKRGLVLHWVTVVRCLMAAHGALAVVALIFLGLITRNVTVIVPTQTGSVAQSANLGPLFAIAMLVVMVVYGFAIWLARYPIARVLFLLLALWWLTKLVGAGSPVLLYVDIVFALVYVGALTMSLITPATRLR